MIDKTALDVAHSSLWMEGLRVDISDPEEVVGHPGWFLLVYQDYRTDGDLGYTGIALFRPDGEQIVLDLLTAPIVYERAIQLNIASHETARFPQGREV